jgi:hypothetical protein
MGVNAANGNSRAQKLILNLVLGAEADRSAAAAELLRAAVEGKEYWAGIFAEYDRGVLNGLSRYLTQTMLSLTTRPERFKSKARL